MNKSGLIALCGALCVASIGLAAEIQPLPLEEAVAWDASLRVVIKHSDLTLTNLQTAMTLTNVLTAPAKSVLKCAAMKLIEPFEYTATNGLSSVKLWVGDGSTTNLFLDPTEIGKHSSPVYLKQGQFGLTSGGVAYGVKTYTASEAVRFTFQPTGASWSLNDLDKGEVHVYFKLLR